MVHIANTGKNDLCKAFINSLFRSAATLWGLWYTYITSKASVHNTAGFRVKHKQLLLPSVGDTGTDSSSGQAINVSLIAYYFFYPCYKYTWYTCVWHNCVSEGIFTCALDGRNLHGASSVILHDAGVFYPLSFTSFALLSALFSPLFSGHFESII